jgi:hypothetical protein
VVARRSIAWIGMTLIAALPTPALAQGLRLGAAAPEIAGGPWINSPALTTAALRGRVLLVEFWTYG